MCSSTQKNAKCSQNLFYHKWISRSDSKILLSWQKFPRKKIFLLHQQQRILSWRFSGILPAAVFAAAFLFFLYTCNSPLKSNCTYSFSPVLLLKNEKKSIIILIKKCLLCSLIKKKNQRSVSFCFIGAQEITVKQVCSPEVWSHNLSSENLSKKGKEHLAEPVHAGCKMSFDIFCAGHSSLQLGNVILKNWHSPKVKLEKLGRCCLVLWTQYLSKDNVIKQDLVQPGPIYETLTLFKIWFYVE